MNFDILVDEINTIPFFTPIWSDVPTIVFIHQLAREVWWYEATFPLNAIGFLAEPIYLRCYRRVHVLTVSASTMHDLRRLGFTGPVTIIPEGLESLTELRIQRPLEPMFLYVGRLAPSKRVSDVIQAFATFCEQAQPAELRLIGEGSPAYLRELHTLAHDLGVSSRVQFLGRVSARDKHREMATAHVLLLASVREGWGLVVTEANAYGTPAIAYDVPGLRDSIRHEETGLLVEPSPARLADAMIELWRDRDLYQRLSTAAQSWSATFTFERTTDAFRQGLSSALAGLHPAAM